MDTNNHYDAIVIGAGPAGLTAGIYLLRAKLKTLIVDEGAVGGQMVLTHKIANYPGVNNNFSCVQLFKRTESKTKTINNSLIYKQQ